jgi:hypothetical protein
MKNFYSKFYFDKKNKAQALREAQAALMKDERYSNPYYWAPFILVYSKPIEKQFWLKRMINKLSKNNQSLHE